MKIISFLIIVLAFAACDGNRLYESNVDLKNKSWLADSTQSFKFVITDTITQYNVYYNIRNTLDYPYARIFVAWHLQDSTGTSYQEKLQYNYLFDEKTGRPLGKSGIGDIYFHRFELLSNYRFGKPGVYNIKLAQFNRTQNLGGLVTVGLRVEKVP